MTENERVQEEPSTAHIKTESETPNNQSIDSEEARHVIDTQVQILRQMNDELLRTARVHVVLLTGLLAGASVINPSILLPNQNLSIWFAGFSISLLSFFAWYNHLGASRLSYTDLSLGTYRDMNSDSNDDEESPSSTRRKLLKSLENIPDTLWTFFGDVRTIDDFEKRTGRSEAELSMLADNYETAIESNNWILNTREKYINYIRSYLYGTFLLIVLGVILMITS